MKNERKIIITINDLDEIESVFDDVVIDTEGEVDGYDWLQCISGLIKAYADMSHYHPSRIARMAVRAVMFAKSFEEEANEGD